MSKRVLVAYATKYGSTREIAKRIAEVIERSGLEVDLKEVSEVAGLDAYEAVIVGSAVYAGSWRKEAVKFLEEKETQLAALPVWVFSSGPTGEGEPVELMDGWHFPEAQRPLAERIGVRELAFFHGAIVMDALNLPERLIVRSLKAPLGDFRDWDAIEAWARGVANALQ
jgi:menaquinone-dependent protoporphyrinogen oxidase